ncbi:MAG TPA: hypothetical protein VKY19_03190 [Ktedonosporobacter sp.]|jgi:tellurite resistance-related uncharacterized protein|nr:hypothetical protein [Ktedonosporobacter sp.]
MNSDIDCLSRFLLLYQFVDEEPGASCVLHIQLYPGCGSNTSFLLLQEKQPLDNVKHFYFFQKKPQLSLSIEEGDIVFIHTMNNEIVTAAGIWQVVWQNDYFPDGRVGYVFQDITSTGIEMVEVKTLLQEEDFALFSDAVAHAIAFLEANNSISDIWFVNGREIGTSAPEKIHQIAPLSYDLRTVDHSWYIVLAGNKEDCPRQIYFLMKVAYSSQNQSWQFSVKLLEERITPSVSTSD